MEDRNLNPTIKPTENTSTFEAPKEGTVGTSYDISVEAIPNVGKSMEAPENTAPDWSAYNPYK